MAMEMQMQMQIIWVNQRRNAWYEETNKIWLQIAVYRTGLGSLIHSVLKIQKKKIENNKQKKKFKKYEPFCCFFITNKS